MKKAEVLLRITGVVAILVSGLGLAYNVSNLFTDFSSFADELELEYFYTAFYSMSAICIACYLAILLCGIQFVRLRTNLRFLFVGVLIFEVLYFFAIAAMWLIPSIGRSVGGATGVANGGLMFQFVVLFPLWAPFAVLWASGRIGREPSEE